MQRITPVENVQLFYQDFLNRELTHHSRRKSQKQESVEYLAPGAAILYDKNGRVVEVDKGKSVSRRV